MSVEARPVLIMAVSQYRVNPAVVLQKRNHTKHWMRRRSAVKKVGSRLDALEGFRTISIVLFLVLLAGPPVCFAATLTTSAVCSGEPGANCGTVNPSATSCKRNCVITVQANPAEGWLFYHWEGDASGSANPTTVRMTVDKKVIAVFVKPVTPPPPEPPPGSQQVVGYFIQWGIYGRNYLVKDVVASGAADTLTTINYAFAGISDNLTCTSLDTFADWGKRFDASESVDGVGDTVTQPLKGNFNQLKKLKARNPNLRVLISIGGWSDSDKFSAAARPENRVKFVKSCVDMFIGGQFAPGVTDPGVFDGIDIDWEYPGACGATCSYSQDDKQNFTALMAEFRNQLTATGSVLTAAMPVSTALLTQIDLPAISTSVDWMNLMTYDFHGTWEPYGPTNHHANLYSNPLDPSTPQMSVDGAVSAFTSQGVQEDKLVIGIPFYGHGWARVPAGGKNGLYQSAGSIPRGTWERGVDDYKVLKTKGYPEIWDDAANASWLYNGSVFWTFDSPRAVKAKMKYINARGLRGVMCWELSGDDGTLVRAIADCLNPLNPARQ
jgi:chitinase